MQLEDLRGEHVGDVALWLGEGDLRTAAFHQHAKAASWHTVNALIRFAGAEVDGAVDEQMGVVEWWRTIENVVALLTWAAGIEHRRNPRPGELPPRSDGDIQQRWSGVALWFSDVKVSAPSTLTGLLTELRDFRNSFEHNSRASPRKTSRHSRLAEIPATANLADLMEALAICDAVIQFIRFALPGVDLMPQVLAPSRVHAIFEPLDVISRDLLFPVYKELVEGRGLSTAVAPYDHQTPLSTKARLEAHMLVRHEDEHRLPLSQVEMDIAGRFEKWVGGRPNLPRPDQFRLPGYGLGTG